MSGEKDVIKHRLEEITMACNRSMKIKDLKEAIANLPDDMNVVIPAYDEGFEDQPYGHYLVKLAGVLENCYNYKAFALHTTDNDSLTFKDTLSKADSICIEELYPNRYQQLVTLRDYKNAGVFKTMPNGFEIYDYDISDGYDEALLLTHPLLGCETYLDCKVCTISPDPKDCTLTAFYIDTTDIRTNARISKEDFIKLIKSESKLKDSWTNEFLDVMGYKEITLDKDKAKLERK